jgi:hypothetical protein
MIRMIIVVGGCYYYSYLATTTNIIFGIPRLVVFVAVLVEQQEGTS